MRRQFELPSFDTQYLDSTGCQWETVVEGNGRWLLIHDRPLPNEYNVERALCALQIPPSYPQAQIDMVYFFPALARQDARPIGASNSTQVLDGKTFQRWSRHRTESSSWLPGEDDVCSHLTLVDGWLEREFKIR